MSGCNLIYLGASVKATTTASRTSLNKQNSKSARAAYVCFISLPSLHDYGMNFSNVTFYGGSKLFLSLSANLQSTTKLLRHCTQIG